MLKSQIESASDLKVQRSDMEGTNVVQFRIGIDEELRRDYYMRVQLTDPGFLAEKQVYQLRYGIVGLSPDGSLAQPLSFRRIAGLTDEQQSTTLFLVCSAVTVLVQAVAPQLIERATQQGNLPQKAMTKYYFVGDAIARAGYRLVAVSIDDDQKVCWLHEKLTAQSP